MKDVQAREAFTNGIYDRLISGLRLAFAGLESQAAGEGTAAEIEFWRARAAGGGGGSGGGLRPSGGPGR
jgi:hypothetical protein